MGEILGNTSKGGFSNYNSFTQSDINNLSTKLNTAQAEVTKLRGELNTATNQANYCENLGWLQSCNNRTGKTTNEWRRLRDALDAKLKNAIKLRDETKTAYETALKGFKLQSEADIVRSEADIVGGKATLEKGKNIGLWAAIIMGVGFGGFFLYKNVIK